MRLGQTGKDTDAGRRRRLNEDNWVLKPPLFAVADGMGGAQAGELASQLAKEALDESVHPSGQAAVVALIQEANRRVWERSAADQAVSGMGTTLTAALVEPPAVWIGHVGDSRAYLLREGRLEQLTEDHSLVAELMRSGRLSEEEAETHPQRSVITRALGTDPDVDVDSFAVEGRAGDVFLLCSDGLTTMLPDGAIEEIVESNRGDLDRAARELVKAANRRGGEDNITVVLFELVEGTDDPTALHPTLERERPDDEDTLDELDAVSAVNTVVMRVDEWETQERAAVAAAPPPRDGDRGSSRRLLWVGAAILLGIAVAALVVWGLSQAHFVGAERDGHVAVYQGVPWDIVGPVKLYRRTYVSDRLLAVQLSPAERRRLFNHDLVRASTALAEVRAYERDVLPT